MNIETRKIAQLKPAEYNPRKALTPEDSEYQKIRKSIETFGYVDPIIINKDGTIIGGHQRFTVLSDMGIEEIDCVVLDLNKQDEKALNIALNKISGEWDELKLKDLLVELDLESYDISLTGFEQKELEELIELTEFEPEGSEDNFDTEAAVKEPPFVKSGEIWRLGNHRLMCGDCTSIVDISNLIGEEKLDLIITDPPYNINYEEKAARLNEYRPNKNGAMNIENDYMQEEAFSQFLVDAFYNMRKCLRDGGVAYIFHADFNGLLFRDAFRKADFKLAQVLIWEKNNFVLGRQDYQWRHEPILYGWKEGAGHYFIQDRTQDTILLEDDIDFDSMKKPELLSYIKDLRKRYAEQTTVIYENKPVSSSMHPTMKPISLIARFIRNSSKKDWNIGDFFAGSGSTLMAAEQLGRTAFCMEIDEGYASAIIKRWEEYTGKKAERLEG